MNAEFKHWTDILTPVIVAFSHLLTPVLTVVSTILAIIWYSMRIYDRLKGKQDGNQ